MHQDEADRNAPIPVVILNWNGEEDTLECLRSIRRSESSGFLPVLIDNGSDPESVEHLKRQCGQIYRNVVHLSQGELSASEGLRVASLAACAGRETLVFIQNAENLGFAKGNNVGVRFAEQMGAEWVMLLNNDTVVAPDAFQELREFMRGEPAFAALTPQIRHFEPGTRIQNCGGRLTYFGGRKYYYADREASKLPRRRHSVVSFVTGCALLFRYRVTGPLTEDFFFGEEDYEFSLRMKKLGLPMACVHRAVIHHKGGASIRRGSRPAGAVLVHYANRLVNVRNYYSRWRWHATRAAAYAYLPLLLFRCGVDPRKAIGMIRKVEVHLKGHRRVDRAEFQAMIISS